MKTQAKEGSAAQNTLADHAPVPAVPAPSPIVPPLEHERERSPSELPDLYDSTVKKSGFRNEREISASKLMGPVDRSGLPETR
jgi:hypothetical protein